MANFKKVSADEYRIETHTGPVGMQAHHIGCVDTETGYAEVFLNYESPAQIHRSTFKGSVRGAKAWVREQLPE